MSTRDFRFEGYSDDVFAELNSGIEQDNCATNTPIIFLIESKQTGESMYVVGHYHLNPNGCWTIGISPVNEDSKMPEWPIRMTDGDRPYSPALIIQAPGDAILRPLER